MISIFNLQEKQNKNLDANFYIYSFRFGHRVFIFNPWLELTSDKSGKVWKKQTIRQRKPITVDIKENVRRPFYGGIQATPLRIIQSSEDFTSYGIEAQLYV